MKLTNKILLPIVGTMFLAALALFLFTNSQSVQGSVSVTNEYTATTTAPTANAGVTITTGTRIKSGQGALGSVVITGANTGAINIYDATTTNVALRTNNRATTTILLATIPASAAANTYTFDVYYTDGLYVDLQTGIMPTTTITYR